MRALAAVLLLTAGLAGCLGGEDGSAGTTGTEIESASTGGDDAGLPEAPPQAPVAFTDDAPTHEVAWENGTFQITEHSYPKGMVTGLAGEYDPDRRQIDLTPLVPQGRPVVLTAEINADVGEGDVDIWIDAPSEEVWAAAYDTPYGGYSSIQITLIHTSSDPITLNVRYDEIDDSQSFDYTLRYAAHSDPGLLPAGVPVGIEVPEDAVGLRAEFTDASDGRAVAVWAPDDSFIGRFEPGDERFTLPVDETGATGEYVVMLAEGSGPARISLVGVGETTTKLRPLGQVFETGPGVEAGPGETEVSWTFEVDRVPLQAGLSWSASEVSQDTAASLSSPETELLGLSVSDGPWVGAGFGILTSMGAQGLTAGTYEAHVSFGENAGPSGMNANHVLVFYDRGA